MSIGGMEQELKWVKKRLNDLSGEVSRYDDFDLKCSLEDLESSIENLADECEDTISSVQDL